MEIIITGSYDQLSKRAADDVFMSMQVGRTPLFCAASGDSPLGLYRELAARYRKQQISIENWFFIGLDEWLGMNKEDEGSCGYTVYHQLIEPLKVPDKRTCFFDGRTDDPENECRRVEKYVEQCNGIEVAVVGLGMNGHIGLNEPGTPALLRSHVSELDPFTARVGQKYFNTATALTHGITLGLATLMEARHVILVVNGQKKAGIVKQVVEGDISENIPGTLFRNHPSFTIYLDSEAAQLLDSRK